MAKRIYLDNGATTPVDKKVLQAMLPYFSEKYGNAMSLHSFGQEAHSAVEKARYQVADFFGADTSEIVFTSGATESNNLVIKGVLRAYYAKSENAGKKPHIITTSFEHHCILDAAHMAEKEGLAEVTFVKPNKDGLISVAAVSSAIKDNTILVSVMYVNNEIGTVQSIAQIGKIISDKRQATSDRKYPLFHTDATQAINYFNCDVKKLGLDLLSMSAHKIYGPKGIGVLYVKKGATIKRVQDGGDQESGMRSGTHNVPGIVGLGLALNQIKNSDLKVQNAKMLELRDYLIKRVLLEVPDVSLNGSKKKRSPNNANFSFKNVEGESLILMLDKEGIAASTGSACSSGSLEPSHVLLSLGMKPEETHGSLRLTLGKSITKKDIDVTVKKIIKVVGELRQISGSVLGDYYKQAKK